MAKTGQHPEKKNKRDYTDPQKAAHPNRDQEVRDTNNHPEAPLAGSHGE